MISIKAMGLDDLLWGEKRSEFDEFEDSPLSEDVLKKAVVRPPDPGALCWNGFCGCK